MDHSTKVHSLPLAGLHSLPIMLHGTIVTGKTMADEDVVQASIQTHRKEWVHVTPELQVS